MVRESIENYFATDLLALSVFFCMFVIITPEEWRITISSILSRCPSVRLSRCEMFVANTLFVVEAEKRNGIENGPNPLKGTPTMQSKLRAPQCVAHYP